MSLAVGIATGMWIISPKTFYTWQRVLCCGLCSTAPAKQSAVGCESVAGSSGPFSLNRPLIPSANPPPPPHQYMPLTISTARSNHVASSQLAWKQSKIV